MAICHNLQVADLGFCDRKIPISGVWHQPPSGKPLIPILKEVAEQDSYLVAGDGDGVGVTVVCRLSRSW